MEYITVGGIERVTQVLSKLLTDYGHEVVIVTGPIRNNEYPIDSRVKRLILQNFEQDIRDLNIIIEQKFDVIILQQNWFIWLFELYKRLPEIGMKAIAIDHNNYLIYHYQNIMKIGKDNSVYLEIPEIRHKYYPYASAIVTLSPFDQFIWKQAGARALYIPNPTSFTNAPIAERPNVVIIVGRFVDPQKQPYLAVQSMQDLHELNNETVFKMIGPYNKSLEPAVQHKPFVNLLGYQSNVQEHMRNASVLMLTSMFEGYPMVVAEAISQGIPVVAFELKYLAVMKCGVIQVPKQNTKKMAEEINKLLTNESLRQETIKFAQKCLNEINAEVIPKWNDLFDRVVNEKEIDYKDEVEFSWVESVIADELKMIQKLREEQEQMQEPTKRKPAKKVVKKVMKRKHKR